MNAMEVKEESDIDLDSIDHINMDTRVADLSFNKTDKTPTSPTFNEPSDNLHPVNDVDLDQLDVGLQNKVVHSKPLVHSKEEKKALRMMKNRECSNNFRKRQKEYINYLEETVRKLSKDNDLLHLENGSITAENVAVKKESESIKSEMIDTRTQNVQLRNELSNLVKQCRCKES